MTRDTLVVCHTVHTGGADHRSLWSASLRKSPFATKLALLLILTMCFTGRTRAADIAALLQQMTLEEKIAQQQALEVTLVKSLLHNIPEYERAAPPGPVVCGGNRHKRVNDCPPFIQNKLQVHRFYVVVRRQVLFEINGFRFRVEWRHKITNYSVLLSVRS